MTVDRWFSTLATRFQPPYVTSIVYQRLSVLFALTPMLTSNIGPSVESNPRVRNDIQALRGFAVLIVLIYHAKLGVFPAGYLGVDVFFVISGFLITRVVRDGLTRGDFSFREFYLRRAKRLLPAAYAVLLLTAVLAPIFLTSVELDDFCAQMVGAVTFTANIVLWRQSGYFGNAAGLKPLLHVWSLSLEEQYYFILPAAMYLVPQRLWKSATIIVFVLSFALCLFMVNKTAAAFYLLPPRGWELAIGSLGGLITVTNRCRQTIRYFFWPAMVALIALPVTTIFPFHPGPDALIICVSTLTLIICEHPLLSRGPIVRGMGGIGDISYSLYLVHWPIFAFLHNIFIGDDTFRSPPFLLRAGLVGLALILAWLLNRYIEEPMRRVKIGYSPRVVALTVLTSCALVFTTIGAARTVIRDRDYANIRQANKGLNGACDFKRDFEPIPQCQTSNTPLILVWGDSFAMHLVPGILATKGQSLPIVQATRGECGPLLGLAPVERAFKTGADNTWAKRCIAFNDSVIRYLERTDSVKIVVLSSPFKQYLDYMDYRLEARSSTQDRFMIVDAGLRTALAGMKATVDRVRELGKKIIVVAPPPQAEFDVGRCLERIQSKMLTIDAPVHCAINRITYNQRNAVVLQFLDTISDFADVDVIDLKSYLCKQDTCDTETSGSALYVDQAHLSREGSVLIAENTSLVQQILRKAR